MTAKNPTNKAERIQFVLNWFEKLRIREAELLKIQEEEKMEKLEN